MAIVRKLKEITLEKSSNHSEVNGTFTIVQSPDEKYLQVDTYGSNQRQIQGKKSQSIRFSFSAIQQLKEILQTHFKD